MGAASLPRRCDPDLDAREPQMMRELLRRLFAGPETSDYPRTPAEFPERFRGRPTLDASRCSNHLADCGSRVPSGLLARKEDGAPKLDLGACLFAPEEASACPEGGIRFSRDPRMASSTRSGLLTPTGEPERVRALNERMRHLFGRSLKLRSVVAGSCGGCEAELVALGNVIFDFQRFGIQFVASPRHADGMLITGVVNPNMRGAMERTYEAIPDPRLVIAVGACAISGGPFAIGDAAGCGVPPEIPVNLYVPGCPPHPITILDGLLGLLGRLEPRQ
jgi:Ni,Fe-hydrogenase III small subunit/formate hydrogenlyase subunit 6/NADH:ubiquinone oxidoreductase subunit I